MIFYGDTVRQVEPRTLVSEIAACLSRGQQPGRPGLDRHADLVEALIVAGQLAQGLADAAMGQPGDQASVPRETAAMALVCAIAHRVGDSWEHAFETTGPDIRPMLTALCETNRQGEVAVKFPEGYAHYALYPEGYWRAARAVAFAGAVRVVGIRSIGTSLAGMAAGALGAPVPLTVRPTGPPFARELRVGAAFDAMVAGVPRATFVVADEGPGLSGSSFAAVAEALETRGVPPEKLVFLPSHAGEPGAMASAGHRERWAATRRAVVDFDALLMRAAVPAHRLPAWVADLTGPLVAPAEDVSGGRWRDAGRPGGFGSRPPADPQNERRKFLLRGERGTFQLKFAGLGAFGRHKLARAHALDRAGFVPEVLALRHGFLVERWRTDLAPLDRSGPSAADRNGFLGHLGRYLAFRARTFGADPGAGASLEALLDMARTNAAERLGDGAAAAIERWRPRLDALGGGAARVATDGRLHAWEWLAHPRGGWLKTDALDHCAGHDLVGCQHIAWDMAGATVEFGLDDGESASLAAAVRQPCTPDLVRFHALAYAAFQLGAWSLAETRDGDAEGAAGEARRYAVALGRALS